MYTHYQTLIMAHFINITDHQDIPHTVNVERITSITEESGRAIITIAPTDTIDDDSEPQVIHSTMSKAAVERLIQEYPTA